MGPGADLTEVDLETTQRWAEQVRAADRRMGRPLVCRPRTDLRGYSRLADLLLIDRRPLGTSLQMSGYAAWVRRQPLLARPGTPVWTTVQTQPNEGLRQQLAALEPGVPPPLGVPPEQIRLLAYTAVAAGSRGLLLLSDTPLDASDPDTQQRATALELLNLELELMEPWAAAGSFVATADSSVPEVVGSVLSTEHARLLLPIWSAPMAQCVPPQSAANSVVLTVPGVPEAAEAYELTPSGAKKLRRKRVAGGMSVTLDEFGLTTQVLLAQDPLIIGAVDRRAAEMGRRAAELERHLAVRKLNTVQTLAGQLAARTRVAAAARWLEAARKDLQTCDRRTRCRPCPGGHPKRPTGNPCTAVGGTRLLGRHGQGACLAGDQSGRGRLRHAAVALAAGRSADRLPVRPESDRRRRLRGHRDDDARGLAIHPARLAQRATGGRFDACGGAIGPAWAAVGGDGRRPEESARRGGNAAGAVHQPAGASRGRTDRVRLRLGVGPGADHRQRRRFVDRRFAGWRGVGRPHWPDQGLATVCAYRVAPQSGTMWVTFALSGLGEARLDDVAIQAVEAERAMQNAN